jgi:hypothetical protein
MIAGAIAGLTLVVAVSVNQSALAPTGLGPSEAAMSLAQKNAAIRPLVRSATECIITTVSGDPRFATALTNGTLGDLIVDSMPVCVQPVRAMINAHDRYFGEGTGEAFFMGPYLDLLPKTVVKSAQGVAD